MTTTINQLSQQEAQALFDYRDGTLFWRHAGSGRRKDLRAVTNCGKRAEINVGGVRYQAHYLVWNWHHGITTYRIMAANGDYRDISIDNLREVETKFISARSPQDKNQCPCCGHRVAAPTLDIIIDTCRVRPIEAKILRVIWSAKGHPVQTQRIFDAMYEDDPDGGPEPHKMYNAFKEALCRLRKRLIGSGVTIENRGYGRGYSLKIGGEEK